MIGLIRRCLTTVIPLTMVAGCQNSIPAAAPVTSTEYAAPAPLPQPKRYLVKDEEGTERLKPGLSWDGTGDPTLAFGCRWVNEDGFDAEPKKGYVWRDEDKLDAVPFIYHELKNSEPLIAKLHRDTDLLEDPARKLADSLNSLVHATWRDPRSKIPPGSQDKFLAYFNARSTQLDAETQMLVSWYKARDLHRPYDTSINQEDCKYAVQSYRRAVEARERYAKLASVDDSKVIAWLYCQKSFAEFLNRDDTKSDVSSERCIELDPDLRPVQSAFQKLKREMKRFDNTMFPKGDRGPLLLLFRVIAERNVIIEKIDKPPEGWPQTR